MTIWQLKNWLVLIGIGAMVALIGWLIARAARTRKQLNQERLLEIKRIAAEKTAAEKTAAERERTAKQAATLQRAAARRAAAEQAAVQRAAMNAALEKARLEQSIAEWAVAEQAEAERLQGRRAHDQQWEAEQAEMQMQAVEEAIAEWLEVEKNAPRATPATASNRLPRKIHTRIEAIHQQVRLTAENVQKEVGELDFIKNRIEAGVDFLPLEFKQTLAEWKQGRILRHNTFDDIKLKFRYKAYSIEDGYELLYLYNDWLSQQRQKLRVFIRLLGTKVDNKESIQSAIEQAEHSEREKHLEMDVDVIFTLRDIRAILEKLIDMETLLRQLEEVCRKRSEQIIAPSWEAKGSL